jgi:hypothetical protein
MSMSTNVEDIGVERASSRVEPGAARTVNRDLPTGGGLGQTEVDDASLRQHRTPAGVQVRPGGRALAAGAKSTST